MNKLINFMISILRNWLNFIISIKLPMADVRLLSIESTRVRRKEKGVLRTFCDFICISFLEFVDNLGYLNR